MNGRTSRSGRDNPARSTRYDSQVPADLSLEAGFLAFWISRQARLYGDLLRVVAHAPQRPGQPALQPVTVRV
jgi:hypothetical protein